MFASSSSIDPDRDPLFHHRLREASPAEGPHAELWGQLATLHQLVEDRRGGSPEGGAADLQGDLKRLFARLSENVLMGGPLYAGHMNTAPMLPGLMAGVLADLFGINMLVPEQSGGATAIEAEVVGNLCYMMGFEWGGGRLTAGGTVSNIEALYIAHRASLFPLQTRALAERVGLQAPPLGSWERSLRYARELSRRLLHQLGEDAWDLLEEATSAPCPPPTGSLVLYGENAHYSVPKAVQLVGGGMVRARAIPSDSQFRLDAATLEEELERAEASGEAVIAVITTAGTTATGSIDPHSAVADLRRRFGFFWHVDAAYGGHLRSMLFEGDATSAGLDPLGSPRLRPRFAPTGESALSERSERELAALRHATSISIDPHKLGFVPKGCGALLLRDPALCSFVAQGAGYIEEDLDPGLRLSRNQLFRSGIEGSRPGRAPLACYAMHRAYPLHRGGLGGILQEGVVLAQKAHRRLASLSVGGLGVMPLHQPDSAILCALVAAPGDSVEEASRLSRAFSSALGSRGDLLCSVTTFERKSSGALFDETLPALGLRGCGAQRLCALRFVFSNPELDSGWLDRFEALATPALRELSEARDARQRAA